MYFLQYDIYISIHALLAESDVAYSRLFTRIAYFYPRSPCGERLVGASEGAAIGHISIHALLAESDFSLNLTASNLSISIHALLAESDFAVGR